MQYAGQEGRVCLSCKSTLTPNTPACPYCGFAVQSNQASTGRILGIVFLSIVSVVGIVCLGTFLFVSHRLTRTEAYQDSITLAESSPEVQDALGTGISAGWPAVGFNLPFHDSDFAQWAVKLEGSRGAGYLYGVANQLGGVWEYSRLVFVASDGSKKVDLNRSPIKLQLPSIPAQTLYLIPLGLSPDESLDWAPAYYKAKFGIEPIILPAAAVEPNLETTARQQLDADKCIQFLSKLRPDLARDPSAILIGVTSRDIYIPDTGWLYAENYRQDGRFAIISSARLHPPATIGKWNPEWLNSRLQKLLTKNIAILYFDLPMSSDYESLLSGGVLSGLQIDEMTGQLTGADRAWNSFVEKGDPGFSLYDVPGKPALWKYDYIDQPVKDTRAQLFSVDMALGLFIQRKMDFILEGEPALYFTRVYTSNDDRSRPFGIGATHNLNVTLAGQMGAYVDLCLADGARIHFVHQPPQPGKPDTYREDGRWGGPYTRADAEFDGKVWHLKRNDGWTLLFPYRPDWAPLYITVLTSYTDPAGREYKMERDRFGDLLSVTTPSGSWLHFTNDAQHRISRIDSSVGRTVRYEYDAGGRLIRVTDSDGNVDSYGYDARSQMLTAGHKDGELVLTNSYSNDGYIKSQNVVNAGEFSFSYFRESRNIIKESQIIDPNGILTSFLFRGYGYTQTLPAPAPR